MAGEIGLRLRLQTWVTIRMLDAGGGAYGARPLRRTRYEKKHFRGWLDMLRRSAWQILWRIV